MWCCISLTLMLVCLKRQMVDTFRFDSLCSQLGATFSTLRFCVRPLNFSNACVVGHSVGRLFVAAVVWGDVVGT